MILMQVPQQMKGTQITAAGQRVQRTGFYPKNLQNELGGF